MMRVRMPAIALAATIIMTMSTLANAAIVIDQQAIVAQNTSTDPQAGRIFAAVGSIGVHSNARIIQTITAGTSGVLNALDLQGPFFAGPTYLPFRYRLSLWDGDAFAGTGALIGFQDLVAVSGSTPDPNLQFVINFDLASFNYAVSPGKIFSISIDPLFPAEAGGLITIGNLLGLVNNDPTQPILSLNQYASGALYASLDGSPFSLVPADLGFRTYVAQSDPAAVPEPAAWVMMLAGFFLVGSALRRRHDHVWNGEIA